MCMLCLFALQFFSSSLLLHGLVICGFIFKLWQNVSRIINIAMAKKHAGKIQNSREICDFVCLCLHSFVQMHVRMPLPNRLLFCGQRTNKQTNTAHRKKTCPQLVQWQRKTEKMVEMMKDMNMVAWLTSNVLTSITGSCKTRTMHPQISENSCRTKLFFPFWPLEFACVMFLQP